MNFLPDIGAAYLGDGKVGFRVWAPFRRSMQIRLAAPEERLVAMDREERGYWSIALENVRPGSRYTIVLDEKIERPDPASFSQPEGVHRPSEVIDLRLAGRERTWGGIALEDYIFYELHVGTFTTKGTFEAVIEKLDHISLLGATSIEIMPVAQFPGARNWGYDGAYPYAAQNSYGGAAGLRRLVDACHERGMAVTLDVVYNHLGPEGAYLRDFGPYFTRSYITPWGEAINFDDAYNDGVRNFFIQNALFWLGVFDIDALRLDAVHAIYDRSAVPFLAQLSESVRELGEKTGRPRYLIAESDLNDSRIIRPKKHWGYGLDSQWSDDFHHSLHALLTGERGGYYTDFGRLADLTTVLGEGYLYSGRYSKFRKRNHGNRSADLESKKFVVASQNHDQVGNRMLGERLSTLVSFEALKVCAATVLLSPYLPLLFMGEEYGEQAPFLYFVDHTDPELREAVRKGRREEFKEFLWEGEVPDPDSRETFLSSRLNWSRAGEGRSRALFDFYRRLIQLRRVEPALGNRERGDMEVRGLEEKQVMVVRRKSAGYELFSLYNFFEEDQVLEPSEIGIRGGWQKILDSADAQWAGPGATLPERLEKGRIVTIRASSLGLYRKIGG